LYHYSKSQKSVWDRFIDIIYDIFSNKNSSYYVDPSTLVQGDFLVFISSLRGEKSVYNNTVQNNNRNINDMNLVISKVYNVTSTLHIYTHFTKKYVYEMVIKRYWWPTNFITAGLFIFVMIFIIIFIYRLMIWPI